MSRVDDLIAELCPHGVEFRALGECVSRNTGGGTPSKSRGDFWGGGIPWASVGDLTATEITLGETREHITEVGLKESSSNLIPSGSVVVAVKIVPGAMRVLTRDIAVNQDIRGLELRSDIDPYFLTYYFKTLNVVGNGTIVKGITNSYLEKIRVPVPPVEIQREIVRILDQFTQLEAELEAELEARRAQHAHYRHQLLTFREAGAVQWIPMGEIAEVRSGWGFPTRYQGQTTGDLPFFKVSDMNLPGNEVEMLSANHYVSLEVAKKIGVNPAPSGSIIFPKIGAAVATNKKRILTRASAYDNNVMALIPSSEVEPRYLLHWVQTFDLTRLANDSGAVPSIRKSETERVMVPVPGLEEQRRIAGVLDQFDALVSDLTSGLPAEIAARRKQYEYYRDRLLTFEEAA